jgi:hypothetical protein
LLVQINYGAKIAALARLRRPDDIKKTGKVRAKAVITFDPKSDSDPDVDLTVRATVKPKGQKKHALAIKEASPTSLPSEKKPELTKAAISTDNLNKNLPAPKKENTTRNNSKRKETTARTIKGAEAEPKLSEVLAVPADQDPAACLPAADTTAAPRPAKTRTRRASCVELSDSESDTHPLVLMQIQPDEI